MTPPETPEVGTCATEDTSPAVSVCLRGPIVVLSKRADFLKAARAKRQGTASMMVQARRRTADEMPEGAHAPQSGATTGPRVGYTCSKKVGNAVARNRAKRRLREAARVVLPQLGRDGWDYVLIGFRDKTANRPFDALVNDFRYAVKKLHGDSK